MFKLLGAALAIYTAYAAWVGRVYAKSGAGGGYVQRSERGAYFWSVCAVYLLLAVALCWIF